MGLLPSKLKIWVDTGRTDDPDPTTGLTSRDKYLIRTSWAPLARTPTESGVALLSSFLKNYPQYKQLFPFRDVPDSELSQNKRYQAHCNAVIHGVSSIVEALDDTELVVAILTKLGQSHGTRKVPDQGFHDLKATIVELFSSIMKPDEIESWKKGLEVIMKVTVSVLNNRDEN